MRPLGGLCGHRWENNIVLYVNKTGCKEVNWIYQPHVWSSEYDNEPSGNNEGRKYIQVNATISRRIVVYEVSS
jgi:hypothetical protein